MKINDPQAFHSPAFTVFHEAQHPRLVGLLSFKLSGPQGPERADELAQETWISFIQKFTWEDEISSPFEDPQTLDHACAWLAKAAARKLIDLMRREGARAERPPSDIAGLEETLADTASAPVGVEDPTSRELRLIAKGLGGVEFKNGLAWFLTQQVGYSQAQAAAVMGISVTTLNNWVRNVRDHFKGLLDGVDQPGESASA